MKSGNVHDASARKDSVELEAANDMELFSLKPVLIGSAHAYWIYNRTEKEVKEFNALLDWFDPHFYYFVDGVENYGNLE